MQVFEQKKQTKSIYSKRRVVSILGYSSYGDPMVWDLYGTEEREARRRGIKSGREENQGRKKERGESREEKGEGRRSVPL